MMDKTGTNKIKLQMLELFAAQVKITSLMLDLIKQQAVTDLLIHEVLKEIAVIDDAEKSASKHTNN